VWATALSAIIECADAAHGNKGTFVAMAGAGGQGTLQAFGAGADFVMLGGMLAGPMSVRGNG